MLLEGLTLREKCPRWGISLVLLVCLAIGGWPSATAQYGGTAAYPYSQRASNYRSLPAPARHVGSGGVIGNPYRNDGPSSGLPISRNINSYYGGGGGNSLARRPAQKPFSNVTPHQPLMTGMQAARIEVARGLWRY